MKTIKVITFGEFLEIAETNTGLIYPDEDDSIRDKNEIGIISGRSWCPIEFSDKVKNLEIIGEGFVMEGIVKYDHDSRYLMSYVEGENGQDLSVELNEFHGKKVKVTVEVLD